jgi:TonB-linked SusC/RagA family outer membrane protein
MVGKARRCVRWIIAMVGVSGSTMLLWPTGLTAQGAPVIASVPDKATTAVRVSIDADNAPLVAVVQDIARQAGLTPAINWTLVPKNARVTLHVKNVPVNDAYEMVLRGTGLIAQVRASGNVTIVRAAGDSVGTYAQDVQVVRGTVVDTAGKGMAGVTVTVLGTKLSVHTSEQGRFSIGRVPVGKQTLVAKQFGYKSSSVDVTVTNDQVVSTRLVLTPVATILSGVVTTVSGIQQRREIGNDISVLNVDSIMKTAPIQNVTDLLETRVPGLTVIHSSGVPGAPSRIRLRGLGGGLLSGQDGAPTNDPIVIVDGIRINASQSGVTDQNLAPQPGYSIGSVASLKYSSDFPPPSSIDQIDPNSIDKIEVFKGPSAAALYGSDAANGVIVITTKRGQSGPTRWSLAANQQVSYMPGSYAAPGYYPFCHNVIRAPSGNGAPVICTVSNLYSSQLDSVVRFQALDDPRLTTFGTGGGNTVTGTVSGGTQSMTYSVTGSVGRQLGLFRVPTFYQDLFQTVYDSAMPPWMRRPDLYQTQNVMGTFVTQPYPQLRTTLSARLTNSDQRQSSAQQQLSQLSESYLDTLSVAATALANFATRSDANMLVSDYAVTADWSRWTNLPLTATVGFSRENRSNTLFLANGILNATSVTGVSQGSYGRGDAAVNTQTSGVHGTLFPSGRLSVAGGIDITKVSQQIFQGATDSIAPGVVSPPAFNYATQSSYRSATGGWFLEPRLNINSRFFVNPGVRLDGGSLSGNGGGSGVWSLFPKFNLSWVAIDRDGESGVVTMLRPRLSFGIAGVQPAPGWQLRLMAPPQYSQNSTVSGLEMSTLGNTQLRPERTREIEGGFDVDLWNGRVSLTATEFYKLRVDAIEQITVAPSVYGGGLSQYQNIGRVQNSGTELSLTSRLIDGPELQWTVGASLSHYTNKLLSLNNGQQYIDLGNGTRLTPGYPLFSRWERPILGYATPSTSGRLSANDVLIADSAVYIGQETPNFELPFNTGLVLFHGLVSVNATFQYQNGMTQLNTGDQQQLNNLYFNPAATLAQQAVALAAACTSSSSTGQLQHCTNYGLIQTVNTFRVMSLSIGYTVPRSWAQRLGVPSISLALQGSNLGLWTNYRGYDPDVNGLTVGDAIQDSGQLPQPRSWQLQVRINN